MQERDAARITLQSMEAETASQHAAHVRELKDFGDAVDEATLQAEQAAGKAG